MVACANRISARGKVPSSVLVITQTVIRVIKYTNMFGDAR